MRRKQGALLALEADVLEAAASVAGTEEAWIHGYALARRISDAEGGRALTAHGTLYKALGRLTEAGLLEQRWEDADLAVAEGRPRRRLYRITGLGQQAVADLAGAETATGRLPGVAPT